MKKIKGYSDWNLTKNKLPKDEEYVLCVLETGKQAVMMLVEEEEGIRFWSEDFPQDSYSTDQVIFWKPLGRVCGVDTYNTEEFEKLKNKLNVNETIDYAVKALEQEPSEDCVSREAVKDILHKSKQKAVITFEDFEELVNKLPSVTPTQRWIPVSERLPEENGFYLVTCDGEICGENEPFTGLAEWVDDEEDYQCVLAWMPLPKPYKAESEG